MKIGCNAGEQDQEQTLSISAELTTSYDENTKFHDELSLTLNYEEIISCLDQVAKDLSGTSLLETVIQEIGKTLFLRFPMILKAKVSLEKTALRADLCKGGHLGLSLTLKRRKI